MTSIHHNLLCKERKESQRCIHKKKLLNFAFWIFESRLSRRQIGPIDPWIRYRRNPPFIADICHPFSPTIPLHSGLLISITPFQSNEGNILDFILEVSTPPTSPTKKQVMLILLHQSGVFFLAGLGTDNKTFASPLKRRHISSRSEPPPTNSQNFIFLRGSNWE